MAFGRQPSVTGDRPSHSASSLSFSRRHLLRLAGSATLVIGAPALAAGEASAAIRLIELVNAVRERYALLPLVPEERLMAVAQDHADDLARRATHTQVASAADNFHVGSNGSSLADRARQKDYSYRRLGENIAAGHREPELTVAAWIESDGHFRNMTDGRMREAGAGCGYNPLDARFQYYWVLVLGA